MYRGQQPAHGPIIHILLRGVLSERGDCDTHCEARSEVGCIAQVRSKEMQPIMCKTSLPAQLRLGS